MKGLIASLLMLTAATFSPAAVEQAGLAKVVAIRAGSVLDPAHGTTAKDQVILIANGKIKAIGAGLTIPAGAEVIDLSREWVIPGLMDAHTHMTLTEIAGDAPFESFYLNQSSTLRGLRGLHNATTVLQAGFTTLRDVGNSAEWAMSDVRRAIDSGWFVGPTIIDSGKIIAPFGGQSRDIPPRQGPFWQFEYIDADSPGVDSIEHGFDLTDSQLKRMKDKGIFLVGTDFPRAHLDIIGTSGGIFPEPAVLAPKIIDRLKRAHKIGVRMAFGSDTVIDMPGRTRADLMLDYLATWRLADVPPMDILRAMTTDAAELLRVNRVRGNLAEGLAADIVAMPANPLEDIDNLRKINFVMKDGKIVRSSTSSPM